MALQCVIDIDEVLYACLAPHATHSFISLLEPLPLPHFMHWRGLDSHSAARFVSLVVVITASVPIWLLPEVDHLIKAREALCYGNKDFVYGRPSMPPYITWAPSMPYETTRPENFATSLLREVAAEHDFTKLPPVLAERNMYTITGSSWSLKSQLGWTVAECAAKFNAGCEDILDKVVCSEGEYAMCQSEHDLKMYRDIASESLSWTTGSSARVQSCADFKDCCQLDHPCGQTARMLCPRTCGCDSPLSELLITAPESGCPSICSIMPETSMALASKPCVDQPLDVLLNDTGWRQYATEMIDINDRSGWPPQAKRIITLVSADMLNETAGGCHSLGKIFNYSQINLCDEDGFRLLPFKSLRLFCPVYCGCDSWQADKTNCPTSCTAA
jgi:hypothetical protein